MLGQPALVARHGRCDAQGEAFLAEQRVAAVAGAVGPDFPRLGKMHDVLVLRVARPGHVGLPGRQGGTDAVHAGHELALGAERFGDRASHARHDAHVGDDIGAVGDFDADLGERRAQRPHRERNHVHGAPAHATGEQPQQRRPHARGRFPVVGRAGVFLPLRADKGAVFDAGDVGRIGAREKGVGALVRGEPDQRAGRDHRGAQPVEFLFGAVGPMHALGLGQVRHLRHPGDEPGVADVIRNRGTDGHRRAPFRHRTAAPDR